MILGHIGVRKGSKGVAGKNFRSIAGRPLVDWSLQQLLDTAQVDAVVLSTDDERIYEYAMAKGCLDVGLRPDLLANDTASKWSVWQHSLSVSEKLVGECDIFLDLDATSPLRLLSDIAGAIELFKLEKPDMVMSCCEARKNPYFNLVEPDDLGRLRVSKPLPFDVVARQMAPIVYEHVASIYVIDPRYLKKATSIYEGCVIPYLMSEERCLDIDSPWDFKLVELILKLTNEPNQND